MRSTQPNRAGTALACLSLASLVHADDVPPTPVEPADPLPEAVPKPESAGADAAPVFPPVVPASDPHAPRTLPPFEGTEYRLGALRVRPAEMKMEGAMLALLALYLAGSFLLRRANVGRARAWYTANEPAYRREFAGVGLGSDKLFAGDGGDEFVSYATGRRGVESVWTRVRTGGYDVIAKIYNLARGIADYGYDSGAERVTLDFKLAAPIGTPGAKFCFAVVNRSGLKTIREERWDLRTFTTTSEYPGLAPSLIALTESGDVTNALLKDQDTGLLDAFREGAPGLEWFESLVVSDMPAAEPDAEKPTLPTDEFHLHLTLRLPPSSAAAATQDWIELACNVADVINGKQKLVPEQAVNKAKKRRAEALDVLLKPLREEEAAREAEARADAAALKRKMEKDRRDAALARLTPEERRKAIEKEEEKERKRVARKQTKRVR
ncbi:hypothetical protein JCM10213_007860 [Rhodosporidiobolus nylandii]